MTFLIYQWWKSG